MLIFSFYGFNLHFHLAKYVTIIFLRSFFKISNIFLMCEYIKLLACNSQYPTSQLMGLWDLVTKRRMLLLVYLKVFIFLQRWLYCSITFFIYAAYVILVHKLPSSVIAL